MENLLILASYFIFVVPSAIIHEFAHGWAAWKLGDQTAKYAGRLTLNPLAHIDKWGTIYLPLILVFLTQGQFVFAYAKPVPYNPYNLKYGKWGPALVGIAGPLSNILIAIIFSICLRFVNYDVSSLNNIIYLFFLNIVQINILLAVFNLVPIPPLDGSKILFAVLPERFFKLRIFLERNGFFILLFFIFFAFELIQPIISWLFKIMVGN